MNEFQIRYSKLRIKLRIQKDGMMPYHKVSMIRGGIGEMLLQMNCIGDRKCDVCEFSDECAVQRIYYHKMKKQLEYVQEHAGMGYLYECEDKRTQFVSGDSMYFNMLLIGDVIVHFPLVLQAITQLGFVGMGKSRVTFRVEEIINQRGEHLLQNNCVMLGYLQPDTVENYISHRINSKSTHAVHIKMITPWTQKYRGEMLRIFDKDAFFESVYRRVYTLNYFEGYEVEKKISNSDDVKLVDGWQQEESRKRYSNTHQERIELKGITGEVKLENLSEEQMQYIYAAELLHIGKNTSMGYGQFVVVDEI